MGPSFPYRCALVALVAACFAGCGDSHTYRVDLPSDWEVAADSVAEEYEDQLNAPVPEWARMEIDSVWREPGLDALLIHADLPEADGVPLLVLARRMVSIGERLIPDFKLESGPGLQVPIDRAPAVFYDFYARPNAGHVRVRVIVTRHRDDPRIVTLTTHRDVFEPAGRRLDDDILSTWEWL